MDEFDDPELSSALRRHADQGGPPLDVGQAFESVRRRARHRRIRNIAAGTAGAAAAVAVVAVAIGVLSREPDVVRTPPTVPADTGVVQPTPGPAPMTSAVPTTTSPSSMMPRPTTTATTTPTIPRPTTSSRATTTTARPVTTTSRPAGPPATTTETYWSDGGSITVRLADGHVSLVGAPEPAAGYSAQVDEDGPYQIRVRFVSGAGEAEIRVEVVDGRLSPTIRNPDSSGPGSDGSNSGPGSGDNSGPGSDGSNSGPGSGSSGSGSSGSGTSGSGTSDSGSSDSSGSGSSGSGSSGSGSGSGSSGSSG